jgi:hypothetical protein
MTDAIDSWAQRRAEIAVICSPVFFLAFFFLSREWIYDKQTATSTHDGGHATAPMQGIQR